MQNLRPKLRLAESYEIAAKAVDDMFANAAQQGTTINSANTAEPDLSEGEDDARSRLEEPPRRSGDELAGMEAPLDDSTDTEEVNTSILLKFLDRKGK